MANETILFILCPGDIFTRAIPFMFEVPLRRQGHEYTTLVAQNIKEGLQFAEAQHIDLVFVIDDTLDRVNYRNTIKTLHANPSTNQLPIILYKITLSEVDAHEIGVDAYFTMPVDYHEVPSIVEAVIARKRKSLL